MSERFERIIPVILKNEGGYVDHPSDPGGRTKYGISQRAFPDLDIPNLTVDQAKEIYYDKYYRKVRVGDILNENIALQIFDFAVNAGIATAIKTAQRIVHVEPDGIMGIKTIEAINGDFHFLDKYKYAREEYYRNLAEKKPKMKVFLNGWLSRIEKCKI